MNDLHKSVERNAIALTRALNDALVDVAEFGRHPALEACRGFEYPCVTLALMVAGDIGVDRPTSEEVEYRAHNWAQVLDDHGYQILGSWRAQEDAERGERFDASSIAFHLEAFTGIVVLEMVSPQGGLSGHACYMEQGVRWDVLFPGSSIRGVFLYEHRPVRRK